MTEGTVAPAPSAFPQAGSGKDILGHPRGLAYLVFAEAWERFSYYGMQALLVLYLTQYLLLPENVGNVAGFAQFKAGVAVLNGWLGALFGLGESGALSTPLATAGAITGVYSAGVYLTPLLGGWIADRFLGRTLTITIGAALMVLGHFLMAFDVAFVAAIVCLFAGVGLFKGNIASQVGELYAQNDLRRSSAYQIFLLGVQIAVIAAPLVVGFLGEKVAWHYGFGAAGVGMAIALVVYLSGRKHLPPEKRRGADAGAKAPPLTRREWITVGLLMAVLPALSMTAIGNQQIFNAYLLWGKDHYELTVPQLPAWLPFAASVSGQTMPVSWLVSLDATISTITVGLALWFWTVWSRHAREPDEIVKLVIGAIIAAGAPFLLAAASANEAATGQKASLLWGIGFHVVNDIGFAMLFPVGLALFSRAAPRRLSGFMIGVYYLHLFMSNLATGALTGELERMSGQAFWSMHGFIVLGGAGILLVFALLFSTYLAPEPEGEPPAP